MEFPKHIDISGICRNNKKKRVAVKIIPGFGTRPHRWLTLGEASLYPIGDPSRGIWQLASYLSDGDDRGAVTDPENDSAFACRFLVANPVLQRVQYSAVSIVATVLNEGRFHGDGGLYGEPDFHVPASADYNPCKTDGTECEECDEPHTIVPSDFYVPPFDPKLYEQVRGHRVEIEFWCL